MEIIFNLYFDHKYHSWSDLLIRSIRQHEPNTSIYIHGFNLSKQQRLHIESLQTDRNDFADMAYDPDIADPYYPDPDVDQLRFQMTCRKGQFLMESMDHFGDGLHIIMDVDMLLIQPLNKLKKHMEDHDVGLLKVKNGKIAGGFIAARNTDAGRLFAERANELAMDGRLYLCKDQKTLYDAYAQLKDEVRFLHLNRRYLDATSNDKAFIWSAHKSAYGSKKDRFLKYLKHVSETN